MPVVWHQPVLWPMLCAPGSCPAAFSTTPSSGLERNKLVRKLHAEPASDTVQYQTLSRAQVGIVESHSAAPLGVMSLLAPQPEPKIWPSSARSPASGVPLYGVATLWIRRGPSA